MKTTTLAYWGRINAIISQNHVSLFTIFADKHLPSVLYRLDSADEHPTLSQLPLPVAMGAMCGLADDTVILMGKDGIFYQTDWQGKKIQAISDKSVFSNDEKPISAIAMRYFNDKVAVLYPNQLLIFGYHKHKLGECFLKLPLENFATCFDVSHDGEWVVIGDKQGKINSYQWLVEQNTLQLSSSVAMHTGEVTAICFEPIAQQFFSAGADKQLFRIHAQGDLQGIDRGKASQHSEMIRCMLVSDKRLYTGADDKAIKSWQFDKGQPNTCKEDLQKVRLLSLCQYQKQPCILAVNTDQSLRFIPLDDGKLTNVSHIVKDGYQRLQDLLNDKDDHAFQEGLALLQLQTDGNRLSLVNKILAKSNDGYRSEQLTLWLTSTDLPKTVSHLENLLKHKHEKVRQLSFISLSKRAKSLPNPLHYLTVALACQFVDVNLLALQQYQTIFADYPNFHHQILTHLQETLNHAQQKVRQTALTVLENLLPKDSPTANLWALESRQIDVQQSGLIRLLQRDFLNHLEVKRQLVQLQNSDYYQVRQTAFYVSVLAKPNLVNVLANKNDEFFKILSEFGDIAIDNKKIELTDDDLEPLLQGLGNPHADISFYASKFLAVLQDERAFGALLRLMNDKDDDIRLGVVKAFGDLGLQDALLVLPSLLNDDKTSVRQVAMQTYGQLVNDPLAWSAAGFASHQSDIHQQALAILLAEIEKNPDSQALQQGLKQALNDPFKATRQEVIKALFAKTGKPKDLLMAQLKHSQFEDVHQVAFAEWQSTLRQNQKINDDLLQDLKDLLNNPFQQIRQNTFELAEKEHKKIAIKTLLSYAFSSDFVDVRQLGLQTLAKKPTTNLLPLLNDLFSDDNQAIRLQALQLANDFADTNLLKQTLQNPYEDVQLAGAIALAKQGDKDSLVVFERFLNTPMPQMADEKAVWIKRIKQALQGLAILGEPTGFAWFEKFIDDVNHDFSEVASELVRVVRPEHFNKLKQWQQDERKVVQQSASLALAVWGDEAGKGVLTAKNGLNDNQKLVAVNGLGIDNANSLKDYLAWQPSQQSYDFAIKPSYLVSLLLLAFYDMLQNPDYPKRLLQTLAFAKAETAVFCASMIARFDDHQQFWQYLTDYSNHCLQQSQNHHHHAKDKKWALTVNDLQHLATGLVLAEPLLKYDIMQLWFTAPKRNFETWQSHWQSFYQHNDLKNIWRPISQPAKNGQKNHWQALAFGALLGVLRQADDDNTAQKAIQQMLCLVESNIEWQNSVQQALLPLLNHHWYDVRILVWNSLQQLKFADNRLADAAIRSPHQDMVEKGFTLWLTLQDDNNAIDQLKQFLLTNSNLLNTKAYRILSDKVGKLQASLWALDNTYVNISEVVINEWITEPVSTDREQILIKGSQNSSYWIQSKALEALLKLNDNHQAKYIEQMLHLCQQVDYYAQRHFIKTITHHISADHAPVLLTFLDNPNCKINESEFYHLLKNLRYPSLVDGLCQRYISHHNERADIVKLITIISGFDQSIEDFDDESYDTRWLKKQYPRHVDVLLTLVNLLLEQGDYGHLVMQHQALSWANDEKYNTRIDQFLQKAYLQLPAKYQKDMIAIMAYRGKKRQGDVTTLKKALSNKDSNVQFLAAEGLAKCGIKDGFAILMATMDYHDNGDFRRRAVLALGELGDEKVYDKLLKLADDKEHFLQDVASEALGHLANEQHGERIFNLLTTRLRQNDDLDNPAIEHWICGLRWLNTPESWREIRRLVEETPNDDYYMPEQFSFAIKALQHHDSQANKDLILKVIKTMQDNEYDCFDDIMAVAKKLFGNEPNQVYPYDWALLESRFPKADDLALQRISQFAKTDELLIFIQKYPIIIADHLKQLNEMTEYYVNDDVDNYRQAADFVLKQFIQAILVRQDISDNGLAQLLSKNQPQGQQLALSYLLQQNSLTAEHESLVWQLWHHDQQKYQQLLEKLLQNPALTSQSETANPWQDDYNLLDKRLQSEIALLLHRADDKQESVLSLLQQLLLQYPNGPYTKLYQSIPMLSDSLKGWQHHAILALLARGKAIPKNWQAVLQQVAWTDVGLATLAKNLVSILPTDTDPSHKNQQLLSFIQNHDVKALYQVASDKTADELWRISAIEALGQINDNNQQTKVLEYLTALQQTDPDADIQRMAFKVLRRYQRKQQKA